jgi:Cu2+-exporting ATPase
MVALVLSDAGADKGGKAGCPSGLAPTSTAPRSDHQEGMADPAPFVRIDTSGAAVLELSVKGAKCAGCIGKIERGLLSVPGVTDARLNLSTQRLSVKWTPGAVQPRTITQTLDRLGYEARPFDPVAGARAVDEEGRFLLRCLGVAAFASMNVMLLSVGVWAGFGTGDMGEGTRTLFYLISGVIAIPCALYAARPFFRSAWAALSKGRANMDVPISLAVVLTLAVSILETLMQGEHAYFDGVSMLLFLLLIGRYLDHLFRERARTAAKELLALTAISAQRLMRDGGVELVSARDIAVDDRILLSPGDRAPVDGVIETGASEVDRSLVTGESAPVAARAGDVMHAGVVNLTRPLTLRASATADASLVAELARLIEAGEQNRGAQMRLVDRAVKYYVPIVHTLAALTFAGWMIALGLDHWRIALMNAAAVLIITCPCALGLASPAVQVVATGKLFKRGVLVRSGDALERLAVADTVTLDKTGTLTLGRPKLVSTHSAQALASAARLARISRHPLSRALVEAAGPGEAAKDAREYPGEGVEAVINGRTVRLGRRAFAAPQASVCDGDQVSAEAIGASEIWFCDGVSAPERFLFRDGLRPDAAEAVKRLEALGLPAMLLSGDQPAAVEAAAREAGMTRFFAALSPGDKIDRLKALSAAGKRPLMVGDGLNDAAALASAHVSAAPGGAVDATQAAADLVFQGEKLSAVPDAIIVARQARRRVIENIGFSMVYNVLAVPAAMAGFITPLIAALAMAGSSLAVTLNALRIREERS